MAWKRKNSAANAAKGMLRHAAKRQARRLIPFKYRVLLLAVLFAAALGITFIPEESVPPQIEPVHTFLLKYRNSAKSKDLSK